MMTIKVDMSAIARIGNMIAAAGKQAPTGISRALNHTGAKAKTAMSRHVVDQTGLKYGTIKRALKLEAATPGNLMAAVYSKGGDVSLKYFKPKEQGAGTSAAPFNKRQQFTGAFVKGGRVGARVALKMGGHVYRRTGKGRTPISKQKSGVVIPEEMVAGASEQAFHTIVARDLPARLGHELLRIIG